MWEDSVSTNHQLFAKKTPNNEPFEFGHGPAQYSHMHAYLPTAFDNTSKSICLIGTSVINSTNDIPLLGSNRLLEKLQAVIDLGRGVVVMKGLSASSIEVPIHTVNGHLAVKIASFPEHVHSFHEVWHALSSLTDECDADVELIRIHNQLKSKPNSNSEARHLENATASGMAPSMASLFAGALPCRSPPDTSDDASCPAAHSSEGMAVPPRSTLDGGAEPPAEACHVSMRARDNSEVRQQARKIQQMPDLRKEIEVGPRHRAMGGSTIKSLASAAAFTVLLHGSHILGEEAYTGTVHGLGDPPSYDQGTGYQKLSQTQGSLKTTEEILSGQRSGGGDVRQLRLEPGDGSRGRECISAQKVKQGNKTWLAGHLRATSKIYDKETHIYKELPTHHDRVKDGSMADVAVVDLIEVFAGKARVSELAPQFGLSATQPFDR